MLGREAVVDRKHVDVGVAREQATGLIVRVEVADHPSAAVEEHEQRTSVATGLRGVVTGAQRPDRTVDREIAYGTDPDRGACGDLRARADRLAHLGDRRIRIRRPDALGEGEHQREVRVEHLAVGVA